MLMYGPSSTVRAVTELDLARERLARAAAEAEDLRIQTRALATATDWQARAAEDFRNRMTELLGVIDRLIEGIAVADGDCVRERSRLLGGQGTGG